MFNFLKVKYEKEIGKRSICRPPAATDSFRLFVPETFGRHLSSGGNLSNHFINKQSVNRKIQILC